MENYKNPITTQENINDLHHLLIQTCLDYMRKHNLTDIDEIQFSADGLNSSYEYGEWTSGTDSCIKVIGIQWRNAHQSEMVENLKCRQEH